MKARLANIGVGPPRMPAARALLALLLLGCGGAPSTSGPTQQPIMTPTPSLAPTAIPSEPVTFTTDDAVTLSGTLFGTGPLAVILAHQGTAGADQTTWQPFARLLAGRGITALTFDFRGGGRSKGKLQCADLWKDVKAATRFLRGRGHPQIVCVGASMGGTACIYDAAAEQYAGLIALSSTMLAGSGGDSLRITDEMLAGLAMPKLFITADADFYAVVTDTKHMAELSPDPKRLVIVSGTDHGTSLFNTNAGQPLTTSLLEFLDGIPSQSSAGVLVAELAGTVGPVYSVAWSPDGRTLASAGFGQTKLWDVGTRAERATLNGRTGYVWGLAWSPDGATLASASEDGSVILWDPNSRKPAAVLDTGWAYCVSWAPDGSRLAVGTDRGLFQVWDAATHQPVRTSAVSSAVISIAWSPGGRTIAVGQWDGKVTLWDGNTGSQLTSLAATHARSDVNGLAWSPDGRLLASAHQDGKVRVWDPGTGDRLLTLSGHDGWVRGVAWSPDGTTLASTGVDGRILVWRADSGQLLARWQPGVAPAWSLAWSPDGKLLATGTGTYMSNAVSGSVLLLDGTLPGVAQQA